MVTVRTVDRGPEMKVSRDHDAKVVKQLDPALLAPQPAPACEYTRSDVQPVDQERWIRLKAEYELLCYKFAEEAVRDRLHQLQEASK